MQPHVELRDGSSIRSSVMGGLGTTERVKEWKRLIAELERAAAEHSFDVDVTGPVRPS